MSNINPDPYKSNISGGSKATTGIHTTGVSTGMSSGVSAGKNCDSVCNKSKVELGGGNIIDLIKKDHRLVEALFEQYKEALTKEQRTTLLAQLIREICMHSSTEEVVVYPVLRDEISKDLAERSFCEHTEVDRVLYELDGLVNTPDEPKVEQLVLKCKELLCAHIKEEESQVLPELQSKLGQEKLTQMGQTWLQKKPIANTRPHPSAPKEGIFGSAAKLGAKAIDAIKDLARFGSHKEKEETTASCEHTSVQKTESTGVK